MKKVLGITFGGLQKRMITLVLAILLVTVLGFMLVSGYQNRLLTDVVEGTRSSQQEAISQVSGETMHQMLEGALTVSTGLRADLADNDFLEIINDVRMLQTIAQGLIANRDGIVPLMPSLPNRALDGKPSAMVLCEKGIDYTKSEYLGIIAHMSDPMIAMMTNSDKIDACYVGLADGTHFGVDYQTLDKYDENGVLIPFPVRERPWYRGAVETGDVFFSGIVTDAFSGTIGMTCSIPIYENDEIVGAAGIDIVLESMSDFVKNASEGSYAYVVNDRGQVVLGPEDSGIFEVELSDEAADLRSSGNAELSEFVDKALREPTGLALVTINDRPYYLVGAPMPTVGWTVITAVDKELTEQPEIWMLTEYDRINEEASARFRAGTEKTKQTIYFILGALLVGSLLAALFAAHRLVRPIEKMTRNIVRSSRTGELFKMDDSYRTNDEIELLAEAFDDLSKKTKNYIEQITKITAEKERINTELSLATKIQTAMMPHIFPPFPERSEIDIYASMDPAKEVGGDFYDYFLIDDDHLCLVIADVSGKGVPAALYMMASKIILQNYAMLGRSPAQILALANKAICSNNKEEMFVTAWLGILDIRTGCLTAANAGHEYPVLKMPDGGFELVKDKHGLVIGAMESARYKEYELQLEPGSKLFVYTDGVPEATDGDNRMFGTERLLDALNAAAGAEPWKILENVRATVEDFVKDTEQFDDLTMLCVEYKG